MGEKGEDTIEAPVAGNGEQIELVKPAADNQPLVESEIAKSSEGNQLDQYIFDSDMEDELGDQSASDDEEIDDDQMGVVDPSKLSSVALGIEPPQSVVFSYIKFDNFPDIDYDAL